MPATPPASSADLESGAAGAAALGRHSTTRLAGLDVLRGVAILMVLLTHAGAQANDACDAGACAQLSTLAHLRYLGRYGVDLFFVLSGFLISSLLYAELDRRDRIDLGRFWLRRGLKIWPSYYAVYLTATAMIALSVLFSGASVSKYLGSLWSNLVFLQNYVNLDKRWFASWSLCIEEHFYLALPLVMVGLNRAGRLKEGLPLFCLAAFVLCLGARLAGIAAGVDNVRLWEQTHYRFDALCFGVLLAFAYRYRPALWAGLSRRSGLLATVALGFALVMGLLRPSDPLAMQGFGLTVLYVGFGFLLVRVLSADHERFVRSRLFNSLRLVGIYSYTIYLAQILGLMVAKLMELAAHRSGFSADAVKPLTFVASTILLGVLVSHLVERPFLRWRSKVLP